MSLERKPIRDGMTPKNLLMLSSIYARLGNNENEKLSSVPFTLEFVRFNLMMVPSRLQDTPNLLQGLAFVEPLSWGGRIHEVSRESFALCRLALHVRRA